RKCNGRDLTRAIIGACVLPCLVVGCAQQLGRRSLEFTAPLTSSEAISSPPNPLRSADLPAPAEDDASVPATANREEIRSPPATAPTEYDSIEPLPLDSAIEFALANNPRLRSALAAIVNARGQEAVAFAPFLPQIDMLNRYVATNKAILPGAPGPAGVINVTGIGNYSVWQSELQLQWMLYDFGRTEGRYGQASMREQIARLQ